jgi:hypothetical protein
MHIQRMTTMKTATTYPQFKVGQKVRNLFGETLTVIFQDGCYVKVLEQFGHYHPTKLFPLPKNVKRGNR